MSDLLNNLDNLHFDILREVGNVGAGNAVTSLSKLLRKKVDMQVPAVNLMEFKYMADIIGSPETLVFGVLVSISGDINGIMMFLVKLDSARILINSLMGQDKSGDEGFDEIDLSAISEMGNILASSYLNALATLTNKVIRQSVPSLAKDMAGAILSVPAIEFGKIADRVLFIESIFETGGHQNVSGYFILVPDMQSFEVILSSLS